MDTKILEDLGLTKSEIKVYLALLELGSTGAGPLIKKLHMYRAAVYELLDLLINKGLVSYVIKANRKYFEAHDPDRLLEYVAAKQQDLVEKEEQLRALLPELKLCKKFATVQEGTIYQGKKGLKSVFEDILNEGKEWRVLGASGKFRELLPHYYIHFHKRRAKYKITQKIIYDEKIRKLNREKELSYCAIRYARYQHAGLSTTYLYADRFVIIVWTQEPLAFMLKSREAAESYREFFEQLWKTAKP